MLVALYAKSELMIVNHKYPYAGDNFDEHYM